MAARRLLGCELVRTLDDGTLLRGRIVETEAYDQADPASHSFAGPSPRTKAMFGPAGFAYVYFTYGMHHCFNIVTGKEGHGAGVLVRAVEPLAGIEIMRQRRHNRPDAELTNGPAKICQAFGIDFDLYGHDLSQAPLRLIKHAAIADGSIGVSGRVGIKKAADVPWRFYIIGNPNVSKPPS